MIITNSIKKIKTIFICIFVLYFLGLAIGRSISLTLFYNIHIFKTKVNHENPETHRNLEKY